MNLKPLTFRVPYLPEIVCLIEPDFEFDIFYNKLKLADLDSDLKIRRYQDEMLRKLISHSYENVPYYRELLDKLRLKPYDFKGIEDLKKLPILTKEQVLLNFDKLVAKNIPTKNLFVCRTSGTTGTPMKIMKSRSEQLLELAILKKEFEMIGEDIEAGYIRIGLNFEGTLKNDEKKRILNISPTCFSDEDISKVLEQINSSYKVIRGYPSLIHILARHCIENRQHMKLNAAICVGETLHEHCKKDIEYAFKCKAINQYAQTEAVCSAIECPWQNGLHIEPIQGIIEQVEGFLVATGLANYTMPLIRYNTGDKLEITRGKCKCGRSSDRIKRIEGRSDDLLIGQSGKIYNYSPLVSIIQSHDWIIKSRFIQHDKGKAILEIESYGDNSARNLKKSLKRLFGNDMEIRIKKCTIIQTKKYKFIESYITK